jgi:dynein-related subfamily AAA family protein
VKFNDILTTLVTESLEVGATPALIGDSGIGKSEFVKALAESMGTEAFVLPCNQLADKADLTGARLVPTDNGSYKQVFYPHHVFQECIDHAKDNPGERPILFLDEINRTTSDVTSGVLTLVTLRKIGHVKLPDNVRIMVAGNDKGNVTTLDEASLSRFAIFRVEPDAATLMSVLKDMNPWVKKVLTQHPSTIFQRSTPNAIVADGQDDDDNDKGNVTVAELFDSGEEMNQITTPRTIDTVSRWLNKANRQDLSQYLATPVKINGRDTSLLNEAIETYVGDTPFSTQLVAVIAEDLAANSGGFVQNRVNVPKPTCYTTLKTVSTVTDLASEIARLTPNEVSGSLLYALKENDDNSRLIEQLAQAASQIEPEHTRTLIDMLSTQQVNRQNLEAFLEIDAPVVNAAKPILSAFL